MNATVRARTRVLITGFGPFPGVPVNATMWLLPELRQRALHLFPGVAFATHVLATEWLAAPERLDRLLLETEPHLALHFGVSGRARGFEVELRATNACAAAPDASGALPPQGKLRIHGAELLWARLPVAHIVTRLRRLGIPAFASRDAGAYLCNATFYHSLLCARAAPGRRVGFVHIPAALARPVAGTRGRAGPCPLTREQAVAGGLEVVAASLGRAAGARTTQPVRGGQVVVAQGGVLTARSLTAAQGWQSDGPTLASVPRLPP
jgi:pyroglutamyl-peptidase